MKERSQSVDHVIIEPLEFIRVDRVQEQLLMGKAVRLSATVEALSLCPQKGVKSVSCDTIQLALEGLLGDRHFGFTKKADGRDTGIPRGTPVRNWRQWSAVSIEDLKVIAEKMNIPHLQPELLGSNITFSGVEKFTSIPRGSTIWLPDGAILSVEDENEPCVGPGKEIGKVFPIVPANFCKDAKGLRGLVGVVFRAGRISVGDQVEIRIPRGVAFPTC